MKKYFWTIAVFVLFPSWETGDLFASGEHPALRKEARTAMHKAATFYCTKVARHGGYVYYYTVDLKRRWGEGEANSDQIWVQPPGTPTVGMAYLKAYDATLNKFYLDAATEAAEALVYGQLKSGGWTNCVDFNPRGKRVAQYRNGRGGGKNYSSLDDGQTQSAIRLLMHVDQALGFKHKAIHESVRFALDALLKAQFANGGFPQVWTRTVSRQKVVKASFPKYDWRTEGRIRNYWDMYTLNDNIAGNVVDVLIDAYEIYKDPKCKTALTRLGDFLILAQMPEPQPAWAQQYNYDMQPIWARRFEPAAITGGESQDAMATLMKIYRFTNQEKYLEPIPRALRYLKKSILSDGKLARYYELKTNRPLYMKRRGRVYTLTYDDSDLPRHYGWKITSRLDKIEKEHNRLKSGTPPANESSAKTLEKQIRRIITDLDDQDRWISRFRGGRLVGQPKFKLNSRYISSAVFSKNIEMLSEYIRGTR